MRLITLSPVLLAEGMRVVADGRGVAVLGVAVSAPKLPRSRRPAGHAVIVVSLADGRELRLHGQPVAVEAVRCRWRRCRRRIPAGQGGLCREHARGGDAST